MIIWKRDRIEDMIGCVRRDSGILKTKSATKLPLTYCIADIRREGTKREEQTLDDTRYGSLLNDQLLSPLQTEDPT